MYNFTLTFKDLFYVYTYTVEPKLFTPWLFVSLIILIEFSKQVTDNVFVFNMGSLSEKCKQKCLADISKHGFTTEARITKST